MGFQFGEMQVREQSPWAYDAANDLVKQGGVYLAAANAGVGINWSSPSSFAAGGFQDTAGVAGANYAVPTGKTAYVTEFFASAQTGHVQVELIVNGNGAGLALICATGGGSAFFHFTTPLVVPAGETVSFQVYNIDSTNAAGTVKARAHMVVL